MGFSLPIFELPLALLPGEQIPLHIFEDRYRRMIEECLTTDDPFGVVLRDADGARSIGCSAVVSELLERFEDGRLNVVATGAEPFRVLDRFDDPEHPSAEVEMIEEDESTATREETEIAISAFADLAERASGTRPDEASLAGARAYDLAGRIELPADTKQELLAMRDEGERMRLLIGVLEALSEALDQSEDVAERAKSNGKIRIGN